MSLVSLPREIRSTPVVPIALRFSSVIPPDASNSICWSPAFARYWTASFGALMSKLSSMMMSGWALNASSSSTKVSTSTWTLIVGCIWRAAWIAWVMLPADAIWFSLINIWSNKPILWLSPPPTLTAYFCASHRLGTVSYTHLTLPTIYSV